MKKTILAVAAITVCGCASVPSPKANVVEEADDARVSNCKMLGTVFGRSLMGGIIFDTGATNAMVDAREKAAALGATHVVFINVDSGGLYTTGQAAAKAYRCPARS